MKLAVTTTTPDVPAPSPVALLAGPMGERVARAAQLGLHGFELMVLDPAQVDAAEVRGLLAQHGLEAAAVASGAQASQAGLTLLAANADVRARARRRLLELIDLAQALGAPLVTVGGFRGRLAALEDGSGRTLLVHALQQGCEHAAAHGVRLLIEPLNRYETDVVQTVEQGLALIEEVGHSHLGLLVDTFHANIEEATFAAAFATAAQAGRLWHVHIGDSNRLPPGEGHIDFRAIVALLEQLGYDGYLSAEHLAHPTPDRAAAAFAGFLIPILPAGTQEEWKTR